MAVDTERVHQGNGYGFGPLNGSPMLNKMHSDGMDEYDNDLVAKMAGRSGGGRRKQSKPIRVFMDEPMDTDAAVNPAGNQAPVEMTTDKSGEENISCDLCNETFGAQSALMEHIQSTHQITDEEQGSDNFPTKYHQLGLEFQQEASLVPSESTGEENAPEALNLPKPNFPNPGNENAPSSPGSGDEKKSNIFHQDAYCDICSREFCNKYFLKTHKANKHGIFDSSPCESPNGFMPALIPLHMEDEESALESNQPKDMSVATPKVPSVASPVAIRPQEPPKSVSSSPKASTPPSNVVALSALTPASPKIMPEKRASEKPSIDMEDYCELCQKHFCNKYYLKKHKQDVHGIIPEDTPGTKRSRPTEKTSPLSMSAASPNPLLLPPNASPLTSSAVNVNGAMPGLSSMANVMFINPFGPPLALLQPQSLMQNANLPGFHPPLSGLPQVPHPIPGAESPKTSMPSSISPTNAFPLPGDAMRGKEVACDLCKKSFCNAYFLKLHKASKHGIPMDDLPASLPLLLPGMPGMPDNFGLPGSNGKELGELPIKKEGSPPVSPDYKKEIIPTNQEQCDICKKEFPNQYSLKIHVINAHNQRIPDMDFLPELSKAESIMGNSMFNNMIAAKLADRVICDICNKEVCNKYFLKTHKIKVHGMDPVQAERECSPQINLTSIPTSMPLPSLSSNITPTKEVPIPPPSDPVPRPSDSELLKMGIDPEAYCEICKKEFCSKYFLKTHKWNLHGIKTADGTPPSGARITDVLTPTSAGPLKDSRPGSQRRNWKWKEPANSMRVMCELCNKELCNKYFLKTHMLNKHGINIDVSAGAPGFPSALTKPQSKPSGFPMPPFPFPGYMKDENSNTSYPSTASSENGSLPEPKKGFPAEMEKILNMVKKEMREPGLMDTHNVDIPREPQSSPNVMSAKTWSIPEDQLKIQDNNEAINLAMSSTERARAKENAPKEESSQEKPMDEIIETTEGAYPISKCQVCGMMFGDEDTLSLHMMRDHPASPPTPTNDTVCPPADTPEEAICQKSPSLTNLGLSLKRKYQFGVRRKAHHMQKLKRLGGGTSIAEKVKSAIVNHIQNHLKKKKFKCAFCNCKFSLRSLCQQHIRTKHKGENDNSAAVVSEDSSSENRPLLTKVVDKPENTVMQPFTVEENAEGKHFASTVVYLPVYNKISKPLSVTFTLTPADR